MTMRKFKPYPTYKDSGIEWLGKIPAHWNVRRLKTFASVQLSNVDKKSVEGQQSVQLCNYTDVYYHEQITTGLEFMSATASSEQIRRFSLRAGDVLITKDSESWTDIAVPALITEDLPGVLCGYHLAHIRPGAGCVGSFLSRVFSAVGPRDQFQLAANGITRFGIGGDSIRCGRLPMPPDDEQRAIAAFLDRETARIDTLIAKKEQLIALLQEKRAALITRAVTKGLNPNAPMKDTGIEWLGEIPAHWRVKRLKHLALLSESGIQMGPFGSMLKGLATIDTGYKLYGQENTISGDLSAGSRWITTDQYRELSDYRIQPGDILLTRKGSLGNACLIPEGIDRGVIDSDTIRVRVDYDVISPRFLVLVLHEAHYAHEQIISVRRGAVLGGLNTATIADIVLCVPPQEEQIGLVEQIRMRQQKSDVLLGRVSDAIAQLQELRSALISAAVTGKIDVREAVA